jgi:hypothetical protein
MCIRAQLLALMVTDESVDLPVTDACYNDPINLGANEAIIFAVSLIAANSDISHHAPSIDIEVRETCVTPLISNLSKYCETAYSVGNYSLVAN